jgi:hypothetical protein
LNAIIYDAPSWADRPDARRENGTILETLQEQPSCRHSGRLVAHPANCFGKRNAAFGCLTPSFGKPKGQSVQASNKHVRETGTLADV